MSGRPNSKWLATMIEKHGSIEAVREIQKANGSKGNKNGNPKMRGFASNKVGKDGLTGRERSKVFGAVGGRISRRTGKKVA